MLNLSYSACYDPYNTIFRMSVLLSKSTTKSMLIETLKIADFFLCFPSRLEEIKPPNSVKGMRGRCNRVVRELKKINSKSFLLQRFFLIEWILSKRLQ